MSSGFCGRNWRCRRNAVGARSALAEMTKRAMSSAFLASRLRGPCRVVEPEGRGGGRRDARLAVDRRGD